MSFQLEPWGFLISLFTSWGYGHEYCLYVYFILTFCRLLFAEVSPSAVCTFSYIHTWEIWLYRREFGASSLPAFPPKKLFALTLGEVEERRFHLEKYLQLVSQGIRLSRYYISLWSLWNLATANLWIWSLIRKCGYWWIVPALKNC